MDEEDFTNAMWLAGAALVLGLFVLAAAGVIALITADTWADRSARVTGTVIGFVPSGGDSVDTGDFSVPLPPDSCPVVRYPADGATLRITAENHCPDGVRVGDRMPVRYNPDDPSDAGIDAPLERWLLSLQVGAPAALSVLIGAGGLAGVALWRRFR